VRVMALYRCGMEAPARWRHLLARMGRPRPTARFPTIWAKRQHDRQRLGRQGRSGGRLRADGVAVVNHALRYANVRAPSEVRDPWLGGTSAETPFFGFATARISRAKRGDERASVARGCPMGGYRP
jgi:hypothetical protein